MRLFVYSYYFCFYFTFKAENVFVSQRSEKIDDVFLSLFYITFEKYIYNIIVAKGYWSRLYTFDVRIYRFVAKLQTLSLIQFDNRTRGATYHSTVEIRGVWTCRFKCVINLLRNTIYFCNYSFISRILLLLLFN